MPPEVRAHALQGLGIVQSDQAEELDGSGKSNRKAPGQGTHPSLAAGPHSTSTTLTVNISHRHQIFIIVEVNNLMSTKLNWKIKIEDFVTHSKCCLAKAHSAYTAVIFNVC